MVLPGITTVFATAILCHQERKKKTVRRAREIIEDNDKISGMIKLPTIYKILIHRLSLKWANIMLNSFLYLDQIACWLKQSREGLALVSSLISQLDKPKRQVELSLWIIDISKSKADSLGVNWQGVMAQVKYIFL